MKAIRRIQKRNFSLFDSLFPRPSSKNWVFNARDENYYDYHGMYNASCDPSFDDDPLEYDYRIGYDYSDLNVRYVS